MKVKLMNILAKVMSSAAAMALVVAAANANSTCVFWSYQPNVPEELNH